MDNVNYERWADFYTQMLNANGVGVGGKVCECACGTGGLTLPLVQRLLWRQSPIRDVLPQGGRSLQGVTKARIKG